MSRIGNKPISVPSDVTVSKDGQELIIKGPKGELSFPFKPEVNINIENNLIKLSIKGKNRFSRSLFGLYRTLIYNMILGVTKGWNKGLEIHGVGFRASVSGKDLVLSAGFSHPVNFPVPDSISVSVSENKINVSGIDKQLVGQVASMIRKIRPAEPYKGKGIRYIGEKIRRKAGKVIKAGASVAGK